MALCGLDARQTSSQLFILLQRNKRIYFCGLLRGSGTARSGFIGRHLLASAASTELQAVCRQDLGKHHQSSRSAAVSWKDFNPKEHRWLTRGVLALACASCLQLLRSEIVIILQSSATIETPSSRVKLCVTAAVSGLISRCIRDKLHGVAARSEPVESVVVCCKGQLENAVGVWCCFSSNFNFHEFSLLALMWQ